MNAKNGTDQLTKTLNGYMEALVHEVIKYDGDIMKFAGGDKVIALRRLESIIVELLILFQCFEFLLGDAILTLWKVDGFSAMRPSIHHVLKCAMSIQSKYGEWTTNVGVKLRVKIGDGYFLLANTAALCGIFINNMHKVIYFLPKI